jgi:hypothetical protein
MARLKPEVAWLPHSLAAPGPLARNLRRGRGPSSLPRQQHMRDALRSIRGDEGDECGPPPRAVAPSLRAAANGHQAGPLFASR